jgi:HSP20 family protein
MKNRILIVLIIILAALLIFETYYLFSIPRPQKLRNVVVRHYRGNPAYTVRADYFPIFERLWDKDPFTEIELMRKRMDRVFDRRSLRPVGDKSVSLSKEDIFFKPRMDLKQTDAAYILAIDLPGMQKSEINIKIEDDYMTVSGERKTETKQEKQGLYMQELTFGKFYRTIVLPEDVIIKGITSEYSNGVLTIKVPRKSKPKTKGAPVVKIPVK